MSKKLGALRVHRPLLYHQDNYKMSGRIPILLISATVKRFVILFNTQRVVQTFPCSGKLIDFNIRVVTCQKFRALRAILIHPSLPFSEGV